MFEWGDNYIRFLYVAPKLYDIFKNEWYAYLLNI